MGSLLTASAVLALVVDPNCGGVKPDDREFANHLVAAAMIESDGNPFVIGVNEDRRRGTPGYSIPSSTPEEAIAHARALSAQGQSFDMGLFGINVFQLANDDLTIDTVFDKCENAKAAAKHLRRDNVRAWELTHKFYNCGGIDCGAAYVAKINLKLTRLDNLHDPPLPRRHEAEAPVRVVLHDGVHFHLQNPPNRSTINEEDPSSHPETDTGRDLPVGVIAAR